MSESVTLLADNLYAEAIEAVKSRAALSASTSELISIFGVIPICEFLNRFRNIPNFDMIQYVECYW
jgi:hypothetical protein